MQRPSITPIAKQVIRCLLKSELHLPFSSLKNQRREYNNKSDGSQPSKPGQPSYRFPLSSHLFSHEEPSQPSCIIASAGPDGRCAGSRGDAVSVGCKRCRRGTTAQAGRYRWDQPERELPRYFPASRCPHLQLHLLWQMLYKQ